MFRSRGKLGTSSKSPLIILNFDNNALINVLAYLIWQSLQYTKYIF